MSCLRHLRRSSWRAAWVCLLWVPTAIQALPGPPQGSVQISFRLREPVVGAYQPVHVTLSILNRRESDIEIDLGTNGKANLEFRIFEGNGAVVKEARLDETRTLFVPGNLVVKPGERFTAEYLLNEWHTFSLPGRYRIEGRILGSVEAEEASPVSVDLAGNMELEILSSSPGQLKQLARDLVRQAVQPGSFVKRQEAVLVLSQIQDPVVVPFLRQIIEKAPSRSDLAIQALGRIRNREAVETLIKVLSSPNLNDRNLAAAILWKLQIPIGEMDPDLLEKVQDAIRPFFGETAQS